ncbi:MAG: hypothetical protein P4N60_16305, partial [Verrucomicrobiae bacterium]|nr:hypothetical protein [Verrucomicrobiae bacterium]
YLKIKKKFLYFARGCWVKWAGRGAGPTPPQITSNSRLTSFNRAFVSYLKRLADGKNRQSGSSAPPNLGGAEVPFRPNFSQNERSEVLASGIGILGETFRTGADALICAPLLQERWRANPSLSRYQTSPGRRNYGAEFAET